MGFFDDAEVDIQNDVPSDPYGFGKEFWPIYVVDVFDVKPTRNGERYGMMVKWAVDHPQYANSQVSKNLGYGNWTQLPVPVELRNQIPWEMDSDEAKQCLFKLKTIFEALGFGADEMGGVGPNEMKGRRCYAKISVKQDPDSGYYQFNPYAFKPIPEDENGSGSGPKDVGDGMNEFASNATNKSDDVDDLLASELGSA